MAFVVSEGQLRSLERTSAPWATGVIAPIGMQVGPTDFVTYAHLFKAQPAVRTVVGFIARNIAQLGIHTFRRVSDTDRQRLTDHPVANILSHPNPSTTTYRLVNATVSDSCIYDNAYWLKLRAGDGQPVGVRRIRPTRIAPLGDDWLDATGYRIFGTNGHLDVPAEAVVHFRGYNPSDDRIGCSPLEALRQILAEEYAASTYREQLWNNGARAAGYIRRPHEAPAWSDDARNRFKASWQAQYAGNGPQSGGTPILEDGMEWVNAAVSPREAQYVESRKLTREEVAAAYYIPPPLVGLLDHATFSNIEQQHQSLYSETLGPWLEQIQQEIELQLVPDLPDSDRVYVEFNLAEKLKGSFEEQARSLSTLVGAPVMTRNEGRALMNLSSVEGGDELITPLNVLEGGLASPADTAPDQPDDTGNPKGRQVRVKARSAGAQGEHATMLKRFFGRQAVVVKSQLGAAKARSKAASVGDVFDMDRWVRELAADLLQLGLKTATEVAKKVLTALGFRADAYDEQRTTAFLTAVSERVATSVNKVTRSQLEAALDDDDPDQAVEHVFQVADSARADEIATTQNTFLSGFGSHEAAQQTGETATKTWLVTSNNPRPTHAVMHGQTVGIDDKFSNGAEWPADPALSVDEVAGCECELEITID